MLVTRTPWVPEEPSSKKCGPHILSEPFLFLYTLSHGIYFTTLPQVFLTKSCNQRLNETLCYSIENNLSRVQKAEVFSDSAVWNMMATVASAVVSLVCILPYGALSDIISKKTLMLVPPILRGLQCLIFIIDIQSKTPHVEWLIIGACLTGLYGDIQGAVSLGSAYMADETPDGPKRTARMIGLGACAYAGSGVGALLSGILASKYGFTYSFVLSASICIINIVLVIAVLPTKPPTEFWEIRQHSAKGTHRYDLVLYVAKATKQTFLSIYQFFREYCISANGTVIYLLIFSYFFGMLCLNGESAIITLFIKHSPLSFSPLVVGEYVLLLMAVRGVGGFFLFLIINTTKMADAYVVFLGFFSFIGTYIAMALSTTQTMLFSFSTFSIGYPLTLSGLRSCLTKRVRVSEHGTVLSFASFVSLLGSIAMTFSINSLFKYTADIFPGICMLFLGGCGSLGMILALIVSGLDKCLMSFSLSCQIWIKLRRIPVRIMLVFYISISISCYLPKQNVGPSSLFLLSLKSFCTQLFNSRL